MPDQIYRYNVIIGVDVVTGGVQNAQRDVEQALTRSQQKIQNQVRKIQAHLDSINFSKIQAGFDRMPAQAMQAAAAAQARHIQVAHSTANQVQNVVKGSVDFQIQEEKRLTDAQVREINRAAQARVEARSKGVIYQSLAIPKEIHQGTDPESVLASLSKITRGRINLIQNSLKQSEGTFEETINKYRKQLIRLDDQLKAGSPTITDYNRKFKALSPSLQEAMLAARSMGVSTRGVKKDLEETGQAVGGLTVRWRNLVMAGGEVIRAFSGGGRLRSLLAATRNVALSVRRTPGRGGAEVGVEGFEEVTSGASKAAAAEEALGSAGVAAAEGIVATTASLGPLLIAVVAVAAVLAAIIITIAIVTAVTVKLAEHIWSAAKAFAAYATEVIKAKEETGLATATVAGLMEAAKEQNVEFSQVEKAMANYRKMVGLAAAGNIDASRQMRVLGIDASTAMFDIDGATRQAIKTIVSLPPGLRQAQVAYAAFGEEGYKLIPFFQSFHGNVEEATKAAEDLGLMLSGKDLDAAREFNAEYVRLQGVIKGIIITFGREFMPGVIDVLKSFSHWLIDNKDKIKDWAVWTGDWVSYVVTKLRELVQFIADHPILLRAAGMAVGGVGGFLVGGPVGAGLGLPLGYAAGAGISGLANIGPVGGGPGSVMPQSFGMGGTGPGTNLSPQAQTIIQHAMAIGLTPLTYATLLYFEGGKGGLSTSTWGGTGGKYLGPGQMGPTERKAYGPVTPGMPLDKYLDAFNRYLVARGSRPGDTLLQTETIVNAGGRVSPLRRDVTGNQYQHVQMMLQPGGAASKAQALLGGAGFAGMDPAALDSMRDELDKKMQETIQRNKTNWDATIQGWEQYGQRAAETLQREFGNLIDIMTKAGESGDLQKFFDVTEAGFDKYRKRMTEINDALDKLENERAKRNVGTPDELTPAQMENLKAAQKKRRDDVDIAIKESQKRRNDFIYQQNRQRIEKEFQLEVTKYQRLEELSQQHFTLDQSMHDRALAQGKESEQQYLDWLKAAEMTQLTDRKTHLEAQLTTIDKYKDMPDPDGSRAAKRLDVLHQIAIVEGQISQKRYADQFRFTPLLQEEDTLIGQLIRKRAEDANAVDVAQRRKNRVMGEELSLLGQISDLTDDIATMEENSALRYEKARTEAVRNVKAATIEANEAIIQSEIYLDDAQVVHMEQVHSIFLKHLEEQQTATQRTANVLIEIYDSASRSIGKALDKIGLGKIPGVGSYVKGTIQSWVSNIAHNLISKLPGGDTILRHENPMLAEAKDHTKILNQIEINTRHPGISGGTTGVTGLPGLALPGGLSTTFGSGGGFGGSPYYNPSAGIGGPGFGIAPLGGSPSPFASPALKALFGGGTEPALLHLGGPAHAPTPYGGATTQTGHGGGGFGGLSGLNKSLFGKAGFGFNTGTLQGIGALAGVAGGAIGGNVGSVLSGVAGGIGTAASLSTLLGISALGGPVGLAIGAAIGAAIAISGILFGHNKQRRADERTRAAILSSSKDQLTKLLRDVQMDRIDGVQAMDQADSIRKDYLDQVGQLKDNKTRNIAIATVRELDAIIAQIKVAADSQQARKDRLELLVPTFADGGAVSGFMSPYSQKLGYVTGVGGPHDDRIPIMASNMEYVLDAETTRNLGVQNLDAVRKSRGRNMSAVFRMMKHVKTPRREFADGGPVFLEGSMTSGGGSLGGFTPQVHVVNNVYSTSEGIKVDTEVYFETPQGKQKVVDVIEENIYRQGSTGQIPAALRRVRR